MPSPRDYNYLRTWSGVNPVAASATVIVPLVMSRFGPRSVLDVGCGTAGWLKIFQEQGVTTVRGYDGEWVPKDKLEISSEHFRVIDFDREFPRIERFDLASCLEVAEHLRPESSSRLLDFLCASADTILWSAAIPGQGGHGHINERWQQDWVDMFGQRGFAAFDVLRPFIWEDARVSFWYRQNCLIFANERAQAMHALTPVPFVASAVHPEIFERERDPRNYSLRDIVRHLPHYLRRRFGGQ